MHIFVVVNQAHQPLGSTALQLRYDTEHRSSPCTFYLVCKLVHCGPIKVLLSAIEDSPAILGRNVYHKEKSK